MRNLANFPVSQSTGNHTVDFAGLFVTSCNHFLFVLECGFSASLQCLHVLLSLVFPNSSKTVKIGLYVIYAILQFLREYYIVLPPGNGILLIHFPYSVESERSDLLFAVSIVL